MADGNNIIKMQCPIWEKSSQEGTLFRGRIVIASNMKRIQVYDDEKWPFKNAFPELYVPLVGADVKLKPITSRNNNHKMGKMTVTTSYTAAIFPCVIHADEVFTFILSLEDSDTITGMMNSWKKSKSK
jgi:hypothetical protein